ncbi:MAG: DUF937 domain-containing protein [Lachnospiraceae bacterium]|nr:DUF937 domain-containing protein [Lachnospiraceae bacterium]
MDLLSMLSGAMTSPDALGALEKKTGASQEQVTSLVNTALPCLIASMTENASTEDGARSLLGALSQHTETGTMAQQIADVDEEDGGKILNHILGDNQRGLIQTLMGQTGMTQNQVSSGLGSMAPALLSGLSAATNTASQSAQADSFDLTDLFGMFGGASAAQQPVQQSSNLLDSLFGGGQQAQPVQQQSSGGFLSSLFGGGQQAQPVQQQSSGGLLSSLFGGGQQAQPVQQQSSGGLLSSLFGGGQQAQPVQQPSLGGSLLTGLLGSLLSGGASQQSNAGLMNGNVLLSILSALLK